MDRNPITYTVKEIADEIGVSLDTVRRYSRQFARHLSEDASPEPGTMRLFTPADLYVLRIARQQMRSGQTYEQVDEYLVSIEVPDDLAQDEDTGQALATTAALQQVTSAVLRLSDQQSRIDALETRLAMLASPSSDEDTHQVLEALHTLAEAQKVHTAAQERLANALLWFAAALVLIVLITVAVASGWIG